jgi:hypothetical protein
MALIKCNEFVKRQVAHSPFSYFQGTWEELEDLATQNFALCREGMSKGSRLVPVPEKGFFSSLVELTPETELIAKFAPRREGEASVLTVYARGPKVPAKFVDIVLYSKEKLAENHENSTDADWEIVSIDARAFEGPTPMDPVTMMRNHLNLPGGSKATYSADDFANGTLFWNTKYVNGF